MKNFIFKSTETDLQKMFQYLDTLQKNMLYATHQLDKCLVILRSQENSSNLQKQVDQYFEDTPQDEDKEPD